MLAAPQMREAVEQLVFLFFEAVRRESMTSLGALVDEDATLLSGLGTTPQPALQVWAARFKRLDYRKPEGTGAYDRAGVGFFTGEELLRLVAVRGYELAPADDQVLVVVNTREPYGSKGPRHFGRRMEFVLASNNDGLRIHRIFEDFRLP